MALVRTCSTRAARSSGLTGAITSIMAFEFFSLINRVRRLLARAASLDAIARCLCSPRPMAERYIKPSIAAKTRGSPTVDSLKALL